jgi:acetyl esterase/lipase
MTTETARSAGLDPALFRPEAIAAETAQFNEQLRELMAGAPAIHEQAPAEIRAARAQGGGWRGPAVRLERAEERTIPGPAGEISLRIFTPETVEGVYLYLHGGGFVLGAADQQDESLWATACEASVAVVGVDYRLAPEHPYPAGPDDCEAAAAWLVERSRSEFGTERLVIGGGSAGGHLAAVTLLRMRDRHGSLDFAGANLLFGWYDLTMTPSQIAAEQAAVIPTPTLHWFLDHFVPADRRRDPDVSPLYADLSEMPPALFTVGSLDPLLDDSLFMHQRWLAAGNESELAVYPGGVHGFSAMPIAMATEATARMNAFIGDAVSGSQ